MPKETKTIDHYILELDVPQRMSPSSTEKYHLTLRASNDAFYFGPYSHATSLELVAYFTCKLTHKDYSSPADTILVRNSQDTSNYEPLSQKQLERFKMILAELEREYKYGLKFDFKNYIVKKEKKK